MNETLILMKGYYTPHYVISVGVVMLCVCGCDVKPYTGSGHVRSLSVTLGTGPTTSRVENTFDPKWKRGKNMPLTMSETVQSVVIGNKVFVGGGFSRTDQDDMYTVMVYDLQGDQWSTLPLYSARWFAMASLNNKLVLVGGYVRGTGKPTNMVSVLESDKWVCPYPALNIARYYSTSVSFNNHIIVAGGVDSANNRISSVEVLDITSNRWCIADPLPCAQYGMKSVVVGNMCYFMGGFDQTNKAPKVVHCVDLVQLTENAVSMATGGTRSRDSPLWHTVEDAPTSALEAKIDKLVYQLYDLTTAEIKIIKQNN